MWNCHICGKLFSCRERKTFFFSSYMPHIKKNLSHRPQSYSSLSLFFYLKSLFLVPFGVLKCILMNCKNFFRLQKKISIKAFYSFRSLVGTSCVLFLSITERMKWHKQKNMHTVTFLWIIIIRHFSIIILSSHPSSLVCSLMCERNVSLWRSM